MFLFSTLAKLSLAALVASTPTRRQAASATGDSLCGRNMCVTARVTSTRVQYELSSSSSPGWMAVGFGEQMVGSPMVVMWTNSDGSVTISQREASALALPEVVASPPRVATLEESLSVTSGSETRLIFTIEGDSATTQDIVYAFGTTNPGDSDAGASFTQHSERGAGSLDLAGTLSDVPATTSDNSGPAPLLPFQRLIIAHGVMMVVGFLFFLPFGSLLARYYRTFSPKWFTGHWISQFGVSGPLILAGFALGWQSVEQAGASHLDDTHKRVGLALFVLYLAQCGLGGLIHFVKPSRNTGRPIQNYFHAIVGLSIIAIAFWQVRTGYSYEWDNTTGLEPLPRAVGIVWLIWVIIIPVVYFAGLAFIKKQYRLEAEYRKAHAQ